MQIAMAATEGWGVGELELLMVALWGKVHAHKKNGCKAALLKELKAAIEAQAACRGQAE